MCNIFRKHFKKVRTNIIIIQKNYRAYFWRRAFLRLRLATLVLQKHRRGQLARGLCCKLREEKRRREEEEERRKREEEERRRREEEERRRREEEERQQREEEERLKQEEEKRLRQEEEEERKRKEEKAERLRVQQEEELKRRQEEEELKAKQDMESQQKDLTVEPSSSSRSVSEEENRQMEEILRLEREIERLQKQREDGVSLLCERGRAELQRQRDAEIYRLEKEASRVATEFLELLDFGVLEQSVSSEENLHDLSDSSAPLAEEEADEGFPAEDECIHLPDVPSAVGNPLDKEDFSSLPPPPTTFAGELEPTVSPGPSPPPPLPDCAKEDDEPDYASIGMPESEDPIYSKPPDTESDYDQEEAEEARRGYEDAASTNGGHMTEEEVLRKSCCTYNSLESYRDSSESVSIPL